MEKKLKPERYKKIKMQQKTVTFWGKHIDDSGMPETFYSYLIIESEAPWLEKNYFIASILPITNPAPLPGEKSYISQGEGKAMGQAINKLQSHSQMQALQMHQS